MKIYKYRINRYTWYWTTVYIVIIVLLFSIMAGLYEGGYLSAWFLSFCIAFIALTAMSIPRKIVVTDNTLLIRCILDITEIPRDEIASVRAVDNKEMRMILPVFASIGFFGYYGHFFDVRNMRHVEIYASTWSDFIEINTIYEDTYYISCADRGELVAELSQNVRKSRNGGDE